MRVSFVLRSAEASSLGLCNNPAANYRDITGCPSGSRVTTLFQVSDFVGYLRTSSTIGTSKWNYSDYRNSNYRDIREGLAKSRQLRGVPGRSPSPVLTRPCIA